MSHSPSVRLGIIGIGNMGSIHARSILDGKVPGLELAALADRNAERLAPFEDLGQSVERFEEGSDLIASGKVDAVLIATPHYDHTTLGIAALQAGLHTLVEKPISVHKADCERLIGAWTDKRLVFAAMFNQRTDPSYQKLRQLIQDGELGAIQRIDWIISDWYRTESYYRSGGWRATWAGEGGGVLLNQCPHNLDLLQWLFGMPSKITANCQFGRFHDIEVEDAVTALLEYPNGATGVFVTTTGEAPGTNRLEVAADRGKVVIENGKFSYTRTEQAVPEHLETAQGGFEKPAVWNVEIPISGKGEQHVGIMKNFTNAILKGEELLAPASEGIHSVELANAMLYSGFENRAVELPLDGAAYEKILQEKIAHSTYKKPEVKEQVANLEGTY
ncbi:MAG: Gfo/Idh/MocA family protein [Verrucomicrobiota bacterium]